jgi:transposase
MSNRIKMEQEQAIVGLKAQGWSDRKIAKELGLNRRTVKRYNDSKCTIAQTGKRGPISKCAVYKTEITQWYESGLSIERIHSDLVREHGFKGSYYSVYRFVQILDISESQRVYRIECEPGQEAQIDYGTLYLRIGEDGRLKKVHLLLVTLSHSRKCYVEAVLTQHSESFLRSLENAFRYFGGVPLQLCPDNLAAAVKKADWYEPEINPKLRSFARHYVTLIMPARPYTPTDKGKVEAGVKYVKNNALKGKSFEEGRRTVHRDSYIEVKGSYYELPAQYIGRRVWVRWDGAMVRVFDHKMKQIATHTRLQRGKFSQVLGVGGCRGSVEESVGYYRKRVAGLGEHILQWADAMIAQDDRALRRLQGLLSLTSKYSKNQMNQAARKASIHGQYTLKELRHWLSNPHDQKIFAFLEQHELIRDTQSYDSIAATSNLFD